jgi:Tfp pilus assembly protein PilO
MTPKRYSFILLGILVALAAGIGYGYWVGKATLSSSTTKLSGALADRDQADQTISQLIELKRQYEQDVVPVMPDVDSFLPTSKQQSQVLLQLETLAGRHNVSIGVINMPNPASVPSNVSQAVASGSLYALPITMNTAGSYGNLQAFLKDVEQLNRFVNVTTLTIGSTNDSLTYNLQLNAYFKP